MTILTGVPLIVPGCGAGDDGASRRPALPRLLSAPADTSYDVHVHHWGPAPSPADLVSEVDGPGCAAEGVPASRPRARWRRCGGRPARVGGGRWW